MAQVSPHMLSQAPRASMSTSSSPEHCVPKGEQQLSMKALRFRYAKAMQSERVSVKVGNDTVFQVPMELLTINSPFFKSQCDQLDLLAARSGGRPTLCVDGISVDTFTAAFIWLHSCDAFQLPERLEPETVLELALFAEAYQVERLLNQATDRLRHILCPSSAKVVDKIYMKTAPRSPIRKLVSKQLSDVLSAQNKGARVGVYHEYQEVFKKHPDLHRDLNEHFIFQRWDGIGKCAYHLHRDVPPFTEGSSNGCKYTALHPMWKTGAIRVSRRASSFARPLNVQHLIANENGHITREGGAVHPPEAHRRLSIRTTGHGTPSPPADRRRSRAEIPSACVSPTSHDVKQEQKKMRLVRESGLPSSSALENCT